MHGIQIFSYEHGEHRGTHKREERSEEAINASTKNS